VTTSAGSQQQLAEQYRHQQALLRAFVVRDVLHLWLRLFDTANARSSWEALRTALTALVRDRSSMSSALATRYYSDARTLASAAGTFRALPAEPPPVEQITATSDGTGVGAFLHGIKVGQPVTRAQQNAGVQLSGALSGLVLDAGRDTVTQAVMDDREAVGWARVTDAHPCAWCAMLAGRGAVYRSRKSAEFAAHSHCACMAAAVFSHDEAWLGNAKDLQDQWQQVTKGLSGNQALNAWRRHWEGRAEPQPASQ
jgi:hypothetical protein